jgi:hypothetical protein
MGLGGWLDGHRGRPAGRDRVSRRLSDPGPGSSRRRCRPDLKGALRAQRISQEEYEQARRLLGI